jgi:hypothetical protein
MNIAPPGKSLDNFFTSRVKWRRGGAITIRKTHYMRTLNLLAVIATVIFIVRPASAELIIYKGTLKQSATGQGVSRKVTSKFYLVVDHDTANIAQIEYTTVNGSKIYGTDVETNLQFDQVSAPKGKTIEAIAHSPNSCDTGEGDTVDSVFLKGTDGILGVNTNSTVTFPKILSGSGSVVSYSSGPAIFVGSILMVSFDAAQTQLSNQNDEKLDSAVSRISAMLEGQGYNQQSEKSRGSKSLLNSLPSP